MKDEFDMSQFTEDFIKEVSDTLEHMEKEMLQLEKNPNNRDLLNSIFRDAHTIKGSAAFLNFKYIKELTHKMENILDDLRNGKKTADSKIIDLLFKSSDFLKDMVNNIIDGKSDKMDITQIVYDLVEAAKDDEDIQEDSETQVTEEMEVKEIEEYKIENIEAEENEQMKEEEILEEEKLIELNEAVESGKKDDVKLKGINSIRVDTKRIDSIMNMVSELVTGRNRLLQIGQQFHSEELNETALFIGKVTTEIQSAVMKIRMVTLEKTFSRFSRIVRDLSKQLGKDVNFIVKGQETELDKIVSEEIYEPILHMLRNSLDHGIESKEERVRAGKNPSGTVVVSARQEENFVYIDISDDGKGINPEKIKNKAIEKGIISKEIAEEMSDYDLVNIIFQPGFSTVQEVSELSGRGVGMDVVKTSIEKIGGLIEVITETGKGSTFRIRLPLTLAIMQVLIIGVNGKKYAIPLNSVVESIRIEKSEVETISGEEVIFLRGKPLPIVYLSSVFNIEEKEKEGEKLSIVVLGAGEKRAGLVIEEMFGKLEIVIKPLGNYLGKIKGVSGSAIMGDGSIIMILDSGVIVKEGKTLFRKKEEGIKKENKNYFEKGKEKSISILYVEDSKSLQKIVKREFMANGIKIETADDGLMGVRKAEMQKYDIIISDYEMPNMDGYEFLKKVRDIRGYKYTPVIIFSARDYEENREKWDEISIADYISKPFDLSLMMEKVGKIINLL